MGRHFDYNSGRTPPPHPKPGEPVTDSSSVPTWYMHVFLYGYYSGRVWALPITQFPKWVELGGEFLLEVRGQSQVITYQNRVESRIASHARNLCPILKDNEVITFEDGNGTIIRSDVSSVTVALSLQRFTLYWDFYGKIGPKRKSSSGGYEADYSGRINWMLFDLYDFSLWQPLSWVGRQFCITAEWRTDVFGTVKCGQSDESEGGLIGPMPENGSSDDHTTNNETMNGD